MGNSNGRQSGTSSPRHQSASSQPQLVRTFDGGSLSPHGIYPGQPDYNPTHVLKYIRERRLAPFYKGLDDYEEGWTDYQLSSMVREGKLPPSAEPASLASTAAPNPPNLPPPSNSSTPSLLLPPSVDEQGMLRPTSPRLRGMSVIENGIQTPSSMGSPGNLGSGKDKRGGRPRAQTTGSSCIVPTRGKPLEAVVYRGAIECPVCFLFYPPNINRTRCCWKPICTECFIEMKRAEPHYPSNDDPDNPNQAPSPSNINLNPMNLVSDPVRCPFCVKTDFGVVYNPPIWLPTEPRQDTPPREIATSPLHSEIHLPMDKREEMYPPGHERVVLSDNIRPDWHQHLAHRRRVEARRLATATALQQALAVAGQRRSSRSSGSRLVNANGAGGAQSGTGEPRRVGRRVDGMIRITRDEADEMMLQEAIRQSLQTDEEERRKREEEERKKNGTGSGETNVTPDAPSSSQSVPRISTSPPGSTSSSPITAPVLPRLQQSMSTSPPSSRSFFSAFRARSGSGSSRSGTTPPSTTPPSPQRETQRRPSSTTNLYPPSNIIRRQPSLPDTLLTSTTASLATAMHDSIVPGVEDSRPSVSSPLASQSTLASQNVSVPSVAVENQTDSGEQTPQATSISTSSTIDEIVPVPMESVPPESSFKSRTDAGNVEERELVEIST